MIDALLPSDLSGKNIYFIGIKGTGMTALAEILIARGAVISGSDTFEKFYTDKILDSLKIPYKEGFADINIPADTDLIVYSAAYSAGNNPEIKAALSMKLPLLEYTKALGQLSATMFSCGICGVHGKTTTTSIAGTLLKHLDLPSTTLAGSGVSAFGGRSSFAGGDKYFVAETCEYRRNFLHFHPKIIVLTSIEPDHLDYYKDYEDIEDAFISYMDRLPQGGRLIYCCDDRGAGDAALKLMSVRPDIIQIPYGETAEGEYKISICENEPGINIFKLACHNGVFKMTVPGKHLALDAAAAIALTVCLLEEEAIIPDFNIIADGLVSFKGSKRRSELKGEHKGILFMDDYGHHPTEISTTLKGIRAFYPGRRIVVDFMSHTYSRTEALFDEFAACFSDADIVVLHKIYSSAREKEGSVNGRSLFDAVKKIHAGTFYFHEIEDSFNFYTETLLENDLLITMGAGNNWIIGEKLAEYYERKEL